MAPPVNQKQTRNRKKKKRRTEDFSDSSSSSSDSEQEVSEPKEEPAPEINIDQIDIDSDSEAAQHPKDDLLSRETQNQVKSIKFTTTENQALAEARETIKKDRNQLENEYLALLASGFANDLDELRKKPDFTEKSIVMLAKTLQSGSNMFDDEALDALLKK